MDSTLSECSDPDEWMALHHGEPGSGLSLAGDASRSADDSPGDNEGGEESNPTNDDVSPVASEKNTVVSEYMEDEYLE